MFNFTNIYSPFQFENKGHPKEKNLNSDTFLLLSLPDSQFEYSLKMKF